MITYEESVTLANKLSKLSPAILGVELFGSVRRNGQGRDADFLILVGDDLAKRWWTEQRESVRVRWPEALHGQLWIIKKFIPFIYATTVRERRSARLENSAKLLGIKLETLTDVRGEMPEFEMFLVPVQWRVGKEINLEIMKRTTDLMNHKNTLGFLKRVASEAIKIN